MTCPVRRTPWTRKQIRAARRASLPPLLRARGIRLRDRGGGNFEADELQGVIVKDGYWRCPDSGRCGNAIDLFVRVLGMSFHQAMQVIESARHVPTSGHATSGHTERPRPS